MAKTKTIIVDGVAYTLRAPPPYLGPYLSYYVQLTTKSYESFEALAKAEEDIKKVVEKIFKETVSPTPTNTEQHLEVLREIMIFITELTTTPSSFREQPGDKGDRRTRTATPPAAV